MQDKFFSCDGQLFNEFVTKWEKRNAECEFETLRDDLIRDVIICGINDNRLRERLLREAKLTLQKSIPIGHVAEETKRHVKELQKEADGKDCIDSIQKKKFTRNEKKNMGRELFSYDNSLIKDCKFYSYTHKRGKYKAYGKNP